MAPSPFAELLTEANGAALIDIAAASIASGLDGDGPADVDLSGLPDVLREPVGAFVSLHVGGALNGCVGYTSTDLPLARSVSRLAWSAAFADPRLPRLQRGDLDRLAIEVSVLSVPEAMPSASREQVRAWLRPHVDGLLLDDGRHRSVFLPIVWDQLPDPDDFVDQLLAKAGLPRRRWPRSMTAKRFTTRTFSRDLGGPPPA